MYVYIVAIRALQSESSKHIGIHIAMHILRKVYNCAEMKKCLTSKFCLSSPENFRRPFFSRLLRISSLPFHLPICLILFFQSLNFAPFLHFNHSQIAAGIQLHKQFLVTFLSSFHQRFLKVFRFSPLFFFSTIALPNLQLHVQLHNCHLQLQITFTSAETVISCTLTLFPAYRLERASSN